MQITSPSGILTYIVLACCLIHIAVQATGEKAAETSIKDEAVQHTTQPPTITKSGKQKKWWQSSSKVTAEQKAEKEARHALSIQKANERRKEKVAAAKAIRAGRRAAMGYDPPGPRTPEGRARSLAALAASREKGTNRHRTEQGRARSLANLRHAKPKSTPERAPQSGTSDAAAALPPSPPRIIAASSAQQSTTVHANEHQDLSVDDFELVGGMYLAPPRS